MKKSDIDVKTFREGFGTYEHFVTLEMTLRRAEHEINRRISDTELGRIEDLDEIFTSDEQLRFKKLAKAIHRAVEDIYDKKSNYQTDLIYKNLRYDEEEKTTDTTEDEFY